MTFQIKVKIESRIRESILSSLLQLFITRFIIGVDEYNDKENWVNSSKWVWGDYVSPKYVTILHLDEKKPWFLIEYVTVLQKSNIFI